ncbi:transposase family protein [Candidatus Nomurabacteria bacterium]|nr:transposase family protein [Candidatus Nomurabacteria bacterium]
MKTHNITINDIKDFVNRQSPLLIPADNNTKASNYEFVEDVLVSICYLKLSRSDKGVVKQFLATNTGYKRAQVTRLINQYIKSGTVKLAPRKLGQNFKQVYTNSDIRLLARFDQLNEFMSGPATVMMLHDEYYLHRQEAYQKLANISSSHIYNLRNTNTYSTRIQRYQKTKPRTVSIGTRAKPEPNNQPGFIRVDSVHQGDRDKAKGVYYVNLVDEVTQWEVIMCLDSISERSMIPTLKLAINEFPFEVKGFHSDNGSEYINYQVAKLLIELNINLTKSRPRHSGDNGLGESKNGSVIRKTFGYTHIPITAHNVSRINLFLSEYLNPYLNYYRASAYRKTEVLSNGKIIHSYPHKDYQTPYQKLKSIDPRGEYLKPNTSFAKMDQVLYAKSTTQYLEEMQEAKTRMWDSLEPYKH